jgi:hypothetical protein
VSVGTGFGKAQGCRPNRDHLRPRQKVTLCAISAELSRNGVPGCFARPPWKSAQAKLTHNARPVEVTLGAACGVSVFWLIGFLSITSQPASQRMCA